jgi:hypothetical protein
MDVLKPDATVLIKLGSIVRHVDEMLSSKGHAFDKYTLDALMKDPEILEWMKGMDKMAFLPLKR